MGHEQMEMFGGEEKEPLLSEEDLETRSIMETEGPGFKMNEPAARELAKLRIKFKKSGKPTVRYHGDMVN